MARDRIPIEPVKRQVAEAWNNQTKKKKHEALKLTMEKQHEGNKAPDMYPCGEHHAFSCPQKEASLTTAEARRHNPIDINKRGCCPPKTQLKEKVLKLKVILKP
jgi:hypothetical protein